MGNVINFFTPLYLLGIYGIVRFFSRSRDDLKKDKINWSPLEAVSITLAIYFVAQLAGSLLVYAIPLARGWSSSQVNDWTDNSVWGQFILIALIEAFSVWFLYLFLKKRQATFKTIGLKRRPNWRDAGYVLLGFGIYFVLFVIASTAAKDVFPHLNVGQQQQIGFSGAHQLQLVPVFLSLVVLPPVVEELLVRGFLYSGLKKGLPKVWAVLVTSGLFAIAHLQAGSGEPLLWIAAIDTFTLSLVLIYLKEKTGSLWASMGLHMLKNFVAFLALFVFHVL
jgi:membrane protease YdiL (CAAX protease family)